MLRAGNYLAYFNESERAQVPLSLSYSFDFGDKGQKGAGWYRLIRQEEEGKLILIHNV